MSTVREVCRRALMRGRVYGPGEEPSADDMADAVSQLNDMMFAWKQMGVDVGHSTLAAADDFAFFVPPLIVAEMFIRARRSGASAVLRVGATAALAAGAALIAFATFFFTMMGWGPAILMRFGGAA